MKDRALKRKDEIIKAGLLLFLQKGYVGTSLNDIVAISGGSLASVYKFFDNKEGLFVAIVEQKIDEFELSIEQNEKIKNAKNVEEFLFEFGVAYVDLVARQEAISLWRLVISESYRINRLAELFSEQNTKKVISIFLSYFAKYNLEFKDYNPKVMAFQFKTMLTEPWATTALLTGKVPKLSQKDKEQIAIQARDIFLNGFLK